MSGKLMGKVWECDLPRNERDVLLAMADHADDFGLGARPSIEYITWKVGISRREVIRCIKWLREKQILKPTAQPGFHRPTTYQIIITNAPAKPAFVPKGDNWAYPHSFEKGDTVSPIKPETPEKGDQEREKGAKFEEKGDQNALKGDSIVSPEPLLIPLNEPLNEPLLDAPAFSFEDDPAFHEAMELCRLALNVRQLNGDLPKMCHLWEKVPILDYYKTAYGHFSAVRRRDTDTFPFIQFARMVEVLDAKARARGGG